MDTDTQAKTLGQAIDEIIVALRGLEEPCRAVAIRAACEGLGISFAAFRSAPNRPTDEDEINASDRENETEDLQHQTDIRSLKEIKHPDSAQEMACLVAYYLKLKAPAEEKKHSIECSDLNKYFLQANFPLPKRMEQMLVNAKAAGYFDSAGRGRYKLNAVGHNLVAHTLPRKKVAAKV